MPTTDTPVDHDRLTEDDLAHRGAYEPEAPAPEPTYEPPIIQINVQAGPFQVTSRSYSSGLAGEFHTLTIAGVTFYFGDLDELADLHQRIGRQLVERQREAAAKALAIANNSTTAVAS